MSGGSTAIARPVSRRLADRIRRLPRPLRSRPAFALCRYLRYRGLRPTEPMSENSEILQSIQRDGVFILHGLFDTAQVEAMAGEVEADLEALRAGRYDGPCPAFAWSDNGVYKLLKIDEQAPSTSAFFEHPKIVDLARAYVTAEVRSYQRMAELRPDVGVMNVADIAHMDDWKHRFKAFLYLRDVGEGNAPFVYYKGSQTAGPWRKPREFEMFRDGKTGTYGHFFPHEMQAIEKKYGLERLVCTGPAGSVVLTDTRGIHHGTTLRAGRRLVLANFFSF